MGPIRHIALAAALALLTLAVTAPALARAAAYPEVREFDQALWEAKTEGADYFSDKEKEEQQEEKRSPAETTGMKELQTGPLKFVLIAAVVLLIVFILLRVFASELFRTPRKLSDDPAGGIHDLEDGLEATPLERLLAACLAQGDYRGAVRYYYLIVLQQLNRSGWISWHRQKTNNQYLWEMREHREAEAFRRLTQVFERVWYGDEPGFSRQSFESVEPSFRELLASIEKSRG